MIERAVEPHRAHGLFADDIAGIQAVDNAVDRIDGDQQHLKGQQPEEQPGNQFFVSCFFFFHSSCNLWAYHFSFHLSSAFAERAVLLLYNTITGVNQEDEPEYRTFLCLYGAP